MWQLLGTIIFWLAWPFWVVYFRLNPQRSRVLIVSEGKLLLVKSWLGDNSWALPGGGVKDGEENIDSACREVEEEVGLVLKPLQLTACGSYHFRKLGISFKAHFYAVKLNSLPKPR